MIDSGFFLLLYVTFSRDWLDDHTRPFHFHLVLWNILMSDGSKNSIIIKLEFVAIDSC